MNMIKTTVLLAAMTGLILLIGDLLHMNLAMAFGFAILMNFGAYWFSDKIVLSMYGAKPLSESDAPDLHNMIARLIRQDNLPMPKLYLIDTDTPNAFATGRNPSHAAVAVTRGILERLNNDELEAVLAHELSHVKNRDILISTIAATLAGAIMMISRMAQFAAIFGVGRSDDDEGGGAPALLGYLFAIIVAPLAAILIQMAISRSREYQADASGARLSGHPLSLANALMKLESDAKAHPMQANQSTAHMFIVNPLTFESFSGLFRTHPPTADRVAKLREMAEDRGRTTAY
jgi:heat shock protein HtpX